MKFKIGDRVKIISKKTAINIRLMDLKLAIYVELQK